MRLFLVYRSTSEGWLLQRMTDHPQAAVTHLVAQSGKGLTVQEDLCRCLEAGLRIEAPGVPAWMAVASDSGRCPVGPELAVAR
jgi:hypothetical protein